MINGFDKETAPLTEAELSFVPYFCKCFSEYCVGAKNVRKNQWIASCVRSMSYGHISPDKPCRLDEPRVRKIINHIRRNDLVPCIIATSQGYYIADSESEIKEYEMSLLNRELAIREVRECITRQRHDKYGGLIQGTLF